MIELCPLSGNDHLNCTLVSSVAQKETDEPASNQQGHDLILLESFP